MRRNYVFLNAEGYMDVMPIAEAEAIDRSGSCSLWEYISTPTTWPQQTVPFVPLMKARPGATQATVTHGTEEDRGSLHWSYEELCQLMKDNPSCTLDYIEWGRARGRSSRAVESQRLKLFDLIMQRKIKWDGERILRWNNAQVDQWPVGFRNPK